MEYLVIKKVLCIFAVFLASNNINLKAKPMSDEELENQIRIKKKLLSDYAKLREAYYIDDETYRQYTDLVLDQLSALLKKRKK